MFSESARVTAVSSERVETLRRKAQFSFLAFRLSALPAAARRDYEQLRVDSLILYPRRFVASDGPGYDQLVAYLKRDGFSWSAQLDLGKRST
jgi:hypothetical protein